MNIIEAINSGRPYKRRHNLSWHYSSENNAHCKEDIIADDWQIQEECITISESQFNEACRKVRNSSITSVTKIDEVIDEFKKELGF